MKLKTKTYEICNSTNPTHLNIVIKITKISKSLGICEIKEVNDSYAMLISKMGKKWTGVYRGMYIWTFKKSKYRSNNGNDNQKSYKKYLWYTKVDESKPGPGPDSGTGGNTSGG